MFGWLGGDCSIAKVEAAFPEVAHGFLGECQRAADMAGTAPPAAAGFEPLGVVLAGFGLWWAERDNVETRSKALIGCVEAFPEAFVARFQASLLAARPGTAAAVAEFRRQAGPMRDAFYRGAQPYRHSLVQDHAWIDSHRARGEAPTIPFRHTAQALAERYFPEGHRVGQRNSWVALGLPVAQLMASVLRVSGG
jgi:hypothetical protein